MGTQDSALCHTHYSASKIRDKTHRVRKSETRSECLIILDCVSPSSAQCCLIHPTSGLGRMLLLLSGPVPRECFPFVMQTLLMDAAPPLSPWAGTKFLKLAPKLCSIPFQSLLLSYQFSTLICFLRAERNFRFHTGLTGIIVHKALNNRHFLKRGLRSHRHFSIDLTKIKVLGEFLQISS